MIGLFKVYAGSYHNSIFSIMHITIVLIQIGGNMGEIFKQLKPYRFKLLLVALLYIVSTMCTLFMPYVMSNIVNNGIATRNMDYIYYQGGIMLSLAILALVCSVCTTKINSRVSTSFSTGMQKKMFNKVNSLSFEEYSSIGTSSLLTRCTEDIFVLQELSNTVTYAAVTVPIMFIGGVLLAWSRDWLLAVVMLVVSPVILLIVRLLTKDMKSLWNKADTYIDIQNKVVRERLSGLRVIRAFDKESYEHERIEDATKEMAYNIIKSNVLSNSITPLCTALLNIGIVLILYIGSLRIQKDTLLTAGDIIATIQYVALVMNGLLILSWTFAWVPRVKVSIRRVGEVLSLKGRSSEAPTGRVLEGSISLDNVTFYYGDSELPALKNISMEIAPGEIAAIIGGTGSGKTTVARLLLKFYSPKEGSIALGNIDYASLSMADVRDNISIAMQRSMVFEGTIRENILMGNPSATQEDLERVAEISQIYDFIAQQANGFDYKLSQSGANLSGGQKQRINISRVLIKKASVYVFDDSFSALDYLTESKLRKAMNKYLKGKTQLIITQRAATAMRCDRIFVMDCGQVVGAGTHEELLKSCSVYKEIYDSQLGGEKSEG